jgi:hypothetical protein
MTIGEMLFGSESPKRKNFTIMQKKIEWMDAGGKNVAEYLRSSAKFVKTSKCRKCKIKLIWGDRSYEFDHRDNKSSNNSQKNCYLVCRNCHGKATKTDKRAVRDMFGGISGYQTIKKELSYKKPKVSPTKKKVTKKKAVKKPIKKVASKAKRSTSVKKTSVKRSRKRS